MKKKNPNGATVVPKVSKAAGSNILSNAGGMVGGLLGGPFGSKIGSTAGSLLSSIFGGGAYTVKTNSIMNANEGSVPSFQQNGDGIEISHREFIGDIAGTTGFVNNTLAINPGIASIFPWLSQVAYNFEEYSFKGLIFEYMPSSGSAVSSTSSALGKVIFATSYDVNNAAFVDKQQMESYEFSTACVPFEKMIHPVECAPATNVLARQYIRVGGVPSGQDARFFDLGRFQYATQGMQSAYTVGELWVSYHVCLYRPRLDTTQYGFTHIQESPANSAAAAHRLGTTFGSITSSSSLIGISTGDNTIVISNPGTYTIASAWLGTGIAANPSFSLGSNITGVNVLAQNAGPALGSFNQAATTANYLYIITVTGGGSGAANTITIGGLTSMSAATMDIFIYGNPYTLTAF